MVGLTSAAGVVGFLAEPDVALKVFALKKLDEQIDTIWTEVAESVSEIEALYEDESFPERELAALVAAKVFYNLQAYQESMVFALGAGSLFNIDKEGEFEDTIISKCVDTYIDHSASAKAELPGLVSQSPSQLMTSFPASTNGAASTSAVLASPTTPFSQSTLPSKSLLSRQDSLSNNNVYDAPTQQNGYVLPNANQLNLPRNIQKQLVKVVESLFERCYRDGAYRQVVGIAIEARNLEKLREAILRSAKDRQQKTVKDSKDQEDDLIEYVLDICMSVVQERSFRNEILRLILDLLNDSDSPEYFSIAKCIIYLNEDQIARDILVQLVEKQTPKLLVIAYQIAFDIYDNSTQEFLKKVIGNLPAHEEEPEAPKSEETEPKETDGLLENHESHMNGSATVPSTGAPSNDGSADANNQAAKRSSSPAKDAASETTKAFNSIRQILQGTKTIELDLEFLFRNDHTDRTVLNKIKDSLEARNSIFHTAVSLANAFMHAGTTHDQFFRENLEWLGKAVNWSKFTATAALGVIHRGNLGMGQKLLEPYLPKEPVAGANTGSAYSQGGSLYALGLIYANHETFALELIRKHFRNTQEEVVKHGGALGLGVAGMATGDEGIYEDLRDVLYSDSALDGEAVGIAMGLIMLGTGNIRPLEDMIQYAHETQHEKIVRGLALGMALIMYGRQEGADELINGLLDDADPILRYGGIQTIALAYCGTSSNKAVRKLLHVAVSDVNDDVRRIAVMSLGFILFRKPHSVPRMVELLSESYNPHVRYGAAMALGISCAGTGLDEAIDLLEPMIKDPTDFVRQGALIALSMIMVQQTEAMNPKVGTVRATLQKAIGDRHEDAMTKFGSAIALGIIDAGGRNCTLSLQTQTGNLNMAGIVGMAVFTQYWYWFPLTHFLSLSFTPTSVIAVDQDLEVPRFRFHSATRPSLFDYPPEHEAKVEDAPEKVKTAVLSTTAQAKRRAQRKEKQARHESMDVDGAAPMSPTAKAATPAPASGGTNDDKMETDEADNQPEAERREETRSEATAKEGPAEEKKRSEAGGKKKAEKEKTGYDLENMSRVLPAQLAYISFPDRRYEPVKKATGGVIMVTDRTPDEPKSLLELKARKIVRPAAPTLAEGPPAREPDASHPPFINGRRGVPLGGATAAGGPFGGSNADFSALGGINPDADAAGGGAAAAAGVLTAVDEDEEGAEEAPVPTSFDYESDGEAGEESRS